MPKEYRLPDLGEGIHEGEIVDVLVSVGDRVEDGQPVLLIETDKATTEAPSPVTGVVKEIRVKQGDVVKVGDVLMVFLEEGESADSKEVKPAAKEKAPEKAQPEKPKPAEERKPEEKKPVEEPKKGEKPEEAPRDHDLPVAAAPSTRRLARELGVDIKQVPPTGPGGRVTPEDVQMFAEKGQKQPEAPPKPPKEEVPKPAAAPAAPPLMDFSRWGEIERVPLRSVRKATAKHMALAWSQIPHVTHQDVVDITDMEAFRKKHKADVEAQGGALSLTVFVLKAAVAALKAFPLFNSSLDMESKEIILKRYYHIAVAVDTERGLLVPVIRNVDRKSITELAVELNDLAGRTREGKVDRDEMAGGAFTITNIGALGGTGFAPIVNYPQVAILGMAQARLQPVVKGDLNNYKIAPRLMMPLIIGFDHRVVDGADAARFLNMIKSALEDPEKLMMIS